MCVHACVCALVWSGVRATGKGVEALEARIACNPPGKFRSLGTTMHLAQRVHLAKRLCTFAIFGLSLQSVLDHANVNRDLH